ncbi:TPA_asm: nucleocapsid protein [Frullania virus 1]|uniref:Nucleoprotein n=1 Tax=Frullania virus 1 TaxID=2977968 RepID=A0A9N7AAM6_9RHAB|nr:TPA_asm: nucleocapsid protein [Frullania virus 1]
MASPSATKPKDLVRLEIFQGVSRITAGGVSKSDWVDDRLKGRAGITLKQLKKEELKAVCFTFMKGLHEGVSDHTIASILVLAWNIKGPGPDGGALIFPSESKGNNMQSKDLGSQAKHIYYPAVGYKFVEPTCSEDEFIKGATFVAASMLKLFTKEPSSWIKAIDHIRNSFMKFHQMEFPFLFGPVHETVISNIHTSFANKPVFKNTLAGIIYHLSDVETDRGMLRMLFEQHIANTGLHAFGLFIAAASSSRLEVEELLSALHSRMTSAALITIHEILLNFEQNPSNERIRKTWKFSRLFDSDMFSTLQTKNCKELTCILAKLCEKYGHSGMGNILDIAVLRTLPDESKARYDKVATNIFDMATYDDENPMFS